MTSCLHILEAELFHIFITNNFFEGDAEEIVELEKRENSQYGIAYCTENDNRLPYDGIHTDCGNPTHRETIANEIYNFQIRYNHKDTENIGNDMISGILIHKPRIGKKVKFVT